MAKLKSSSFVYLRPTIIFLIANILTYTIHELSHAVTSYTMGIPAELFPFYTNISRTTGTVNEKAVISVVGPLVSLLIGFVCLLAFKQSKSPAPKLFLLYTYILGVSIFLGNLFSASMAGDFHRFFNLLGFSSTIQIIVTALGLIFLIWFMWSIGKAFLNFKFSEQNSKKIVILDTIIIPWILGTVLLIICYLPLPGPLIIGIISSSLFWIFTVIGAWKNNSKADRETFQLAGIAVIDVIILILCIAMIRIVTNGISFLP